jgi:D-sedoheptulose 7-phosphate isomerase
MAAEAMVQSWHDGGKLLVCGNGGSAADGLHIVGEVMKAFALPRPLPIEDRDRIAATAPAEAEYIANHLQGALPAIALPAETGLNTAFANDVSADLIFAQQVYGYGRPGDVLLAISTSGNSRNVVLAAYVAKAFGVTVIALTGEGGGQLMGIADVSIRVPEQEVYKIQELHLPVYHAVCLVAENEFFGTPD